MPDATSAPLTLDDLRAIRDGLMEARDRAWAFVGPEPAGGILGGWVVCLRCGGAGLWPSSIAHRHLMTDGGPVLCRVARLRAVLPKVVRLVQEMEGRSGDSPVVGGMGR